MENIWGNAVVIAVLIVVAYFWWRGRQKTKAEVWEGVLENKDEKSMTDSEGDETTWYMLYVRLSTGEMKEVEVNEKLFEQLEIGDKISKQAGQLYPAKAA